MEEGEGEEWRKGELKEGESGRGGGGGEEMMLL